jgi:hypothetical protein
MVWVEVYSSGFSSKLGISKINFIGMDGHVGLFLMGLFTNQDRSNKFIVTKKGN